MIRLRPSGADEVLIKRVRDWYEPGPGVFIASTAGQTASFTPASLFTGSTNGVWYDPSDLTLGNMYQDSAKTTPVTAVEQPVGWIQDKSGKGNHAFQSNSANRPTLSARYNLLTKTEDFSDGVVWERANGANGSAPVVTADYEAGPFAGTLADRVQLARTTDSNSFSQLSTLMTSALTNGVTYIASVWMKSRSGSVVVDMGSFNGAYGSYKPTVTTEWQRFSYQWTVSTAASRFGPLLFQATGTALTADLLIWGADLRVANDALNQPAYQRVGNVSVTPSDYDTVGFKPYLKFNGTSSSMVTGSIDFTNTAQMFVSAGVRKLSDATFQFPVELSSSVNTQNGSFAIVTSSAVPYKYAFASRGSITVDPYTNNSAYSAPVTNVLSGISDIDGAPDQAILRVNSTQAAISTADQGNVPYGTYPIYIGARAGSSLWFNGRLYQLVVAGKQASASEITDTETYLNTKTGAY